MHNTTANDAIVQKTRELCQIIVDQPEFQNIRRSLEAFLADANAQTQYQNLSEKGRELHNKQNQGIRLEESEIAGFEKERTALFENPVARDFLSAQEQMHQMQETINQYVTRTFELGRVPGEKDFESCGHGCSCHH